jgi:hypothetical protein
MSAIKAGDMVIFMRACCSEGDPYLGMVYQVEAIEGRFPYVHCDGCSTKHVGRFARFKLSADAPFTAYIPPKWLKKIPPLVEVETAKHTEEITA